MLVREALELAHHSSAKTAHCGPRWKSPQAGAVHPITQDPAMTKLLEAARQIAPTDCNVIVTGGAGGTGKGAAGALHPRP